MMLGILSAFPLSAAPPERAMVETLAIHSAGKCHQFMVEIASSPEQRRQGLSGRHELPVDRGMLFDMGQKQKVSMWMVNTFIPLDMIFIKTDGTIAAVHHQAVPQSRELINSPEPVRAVLEIGGGLALQLGISRGDLIHHPLFTDQPCSP